MLFVPWSIRTRRSKITAAQLNRGVSKVSPAQMETPVDGSETSEALKEGSRGSRDFSCRDEYAVFLRKLFDQLNAGRRARFEEELEVLGRILFTAPFHSLLSVIRWSICV